MTRTLSVFLLASGAVLALAAVTDPVSLKMAPKVDQKNKYSTAMDFEVGGTQGTFSASVATKVTDVTEKGYTVEFTMTDGVAKIGATDTPNNVDPYTISFDPLNKALKVQATDNATETLRMTRLITPVAPEKAVNVGDTWTYTYEADKDASTPKEDCSYKVEALEDMDGQHTAKVTFDHKETDGDVPAEVIGTFWIRMDGVVVKLDSTITSLPVGPYTLNGKLTQSLAK